MRTVRSWETRCPWEVFHMAAGATSIRRDVVPASSCTSSVLTASCPAKRRMDWRTQAMRRTCTMLASLVTAATYGRKGASWASSTIRCTRSPRKGLHEAKRRYEREEDEDASVSRRQLCMAKHASMTHADTMETLKMGRETMV